MPLKEKRMEDGKILIYYGEGHGKSTAAIGKAIQAAGEGKSAIIIQFLKGKNEEEQEFLSRLEPEIKIFRFAKSDICFDELNERQQQEEIMNLRNGFNYGRKVITTGGCDLIVLDEVLGLVDLKVIDIEELKQLLAAKPEDVTVICTGRVLDNRLRENVDEIYNIASEK